MASGHQVHMLTHRPAAAIRAHVTVDLEASRVVGGEDGVNAIILLSTQEDVQAVSGPGACSAEGPSGWPWPRPMSRHLLLPRQSLALSVSLWTRLPTPQCHVQSKAGPQGRNWAPTPSGPHFSLLENRLGAPVRCSEPFGHRSPQSPGEVPLSTRAEGWVAEGGAQQGPSSPCSPGWPPKSPGR